MKRVAKATLSAAFLSAMLIGQTTINGGRTILGRWDASNAMKTLPVKSGAADPGSCESGEMFANTSTTPAKLKYCQSGAWTELGGGGGATASVGLIDNTGVWSVLGSDLRVINIEDEFLITNQTSGQIGALGWRGAATHSVQAWPMIGAANCTTAATTDSLGGLWLPDSGSTVALFPPIFQQTNKIWRSCFTIYPTETADVGYYIGWWDGAATQTIAGGAVLVEYDPSVNANWRLLMRQDSISYRGTVDLAPYSANTLTSICFRSDGTVNEKFWVRVNNGTEQSVCRSGCDVNVTGGTVSLWGRNYTPRFHVRTRTTAAKTLIIDSFKATFYTGGASAWQR